MPALVLHATQVDAVADASRWSGCEVWRSDAAIQAELADTDVQCEVLERIEPNRMIAEFDARIGGILNSTDDLPYSGQGRLFVHWWRPCIVL